MKHWSEKYIGRPWTPEFDCVGLVATVLEEQFNQTLALPVGLDWKRLGFAGAVHHFETFAAPLPGSAAMEPDGVLLKVQGNRLSLGHHIGVLVNQGPKRFLLHNMERVGVLLQPLRTVGRVNLEISGFYRWRTSPRHASSCLASP